MPNILNFVRRPAAPAPSETEAVARFLDGASLEVMPRTAAKIEDFRALLPLGARVYVAHIDGTDPAEIAATCRRLTDQGFAAMPHVPARGVESAADLDRRLGLYADAGAREALALAGGIDRARGPFPDSLAMLETGRFTARGFARVHVAGHPEGNRDIDPDGGETAAMAALRRKAAFARDAGVEMAIVTQFAFEAAPIIDWAARLRAAGIQLPVHVGVAGPAKLQTMIKFAMACGVGASLRVLQRRAADLSNLVLPFEPTDLVAELARHRAAHPEFQVEAAHLFPLGGIAATADYLTTARAAPARALA